MMHKCFSSLSLSRLWKTTDKRAMCWNERTGRWGERLAHLLYSLLWLSMTQNCFRTFTLKPPCPTLKGHTDKPILAYNSCCVQNELDFHRVQLWRIRGMFWGTYIFWQLGRHLRAAEIAYFSIILPCPDYVAPHIKKSTKYMTKQIPIWLSSWSSSPNHLQI